MKDTGTAAETGADADTVTALFPGCSLEAAGASFLKSLKRVFRILDIPYRELDQWSCCGATSAHAVDHRLHLSLNLRNLALAETQGITDLIVPCAACYHRLANTNHTLENDPELLENLNKQADSNYRGKVKVRNLLDFLVNHVGLETIAAQVTAPLPYSKIACYYGCLNTRIPRMKSFDTVEYPTSMDRLARTLGAETIDWSYKTECCGAGHFITNEKISHKLTGKILADAHARNADLIVVSCPMCHNNLDTKQKQIRKQADISRPIPILFITQLMGLAFGLKPRHLALGRHFVPLPRPAGTTAAPPKRTPPNTPGV